MYIQKQFESYDTCENCEDCEFNMCQSTYIFYDCFPVFD